MNPSPSSWSRSWPREWEWVWVWMNKNQPIWRISAKGALKENQKDIKSIYFLSQMITKFDHKDEQNPGPWDYNEPA